MAELFSTTALLAFVTLTALEIVLGVDNFVFIAILSGRLPEAQRPKARNLGLALAALGRIVLLLAITWVITLDRTVLFEWGEASAGSAQVEGATGNESPADDGDHADAGAQGEVGPHASGPGPEGDLVRITVKDLILILGGVFLLGKATWEIHANLEGKHGEDEDADAAPPKFGAVIGQILLLDMVFSIDSVLTAVGMVNPSDYTSGYFPGTSIPWPPLVIMASAVIVAIVVMLAFAGPLSRFIEKHPTMKMLALSFLLLIGVVLVAEGLHQHIPRGYIYFAMGFSLFVELLNLKFWKKRRKARPVPEKH